MASATSSAVDGSCLMPDERIRDVCTAMVAGALAAAAYWATSLCDCSSEAAAGSGGCSTKGSAEQQPQQGYMQQAAFDMSPAAQQLLLRAPPLGSTASSVAGRTSCSAA